MAKRRGKKGKAARASRPKRAAAAKGKRPAVKPKGKVKAPAKRGPAPAAASEMAKLRDEVTHWQHLHSQLQEQVRAKDSTIGKLMAELMELRRSVEELRARAQPKHP